MKKNMWLVLISLKQKSKKKTNQKNQKQKPKQKPKNNPPPNPHKKQKNRGIALTIQKFILHQCFFSFCPAYGRFRLQTIEDIKQNKNTNYDSYNQRPQIPEALGWGPWVCSWRQLADVGGQVRFLKCNFSLLKVNL